LFLFQLHAALSVPFIEKLPEIGERAKLHKIVANFWMFGMYLRVLDAKLFHVENCPFFAVQLTRKRKMLFDDLPLFTQ